MSVGVELYLPITDSFEPSLHELRWLAALMSAAALCAIVVFELRHCAHEGQMCFSDACVKPPCQHAIGANNMHSAPCGHSESSALQTSIVYAVVCDCSAYTHAQPYIYRSVISAQ
jgi:hypothetical protein